MRVGAIVAIGLAAALVAAALVARARFRRMRALSAARAADVRFLTGDEAAALLRADPDGYVASLTRADLAARGAPSAAAYLARAAALARDATADERRAVARAIGDVQAWLRAPERAARVVGGVAFADLADLPWRVAITAPKPGVAGAYEGGLPHTRGDAIFLSPSVLPTGDDAVSRKRLATTLLHEKAHVVQRRRAADVARALAAAGYERVGARRDVPLARANPDLDAWVYRDPEPGATQGAPMVATYASEAPSGIADVAPSAGAASFEHPHERFAYRIAAMY